MKYLVSEKQLKRIVETSIEVEESQLEGFYKVGIYLNLPLHEIKPTRETHPELFKTKYTDNGFPIPLKITTIKSGVKLVNKATGEVFAKRKVGEPPASINQFMSGYKTPDGVYGIGNCNNDSNTICALKIPESYIYNLKILSSEEDMYYVKIFFKIYDSFDRTMILELVKDSD